MADKSIDKEARAGAEQGADAWRAVLADPGSFSGRSGGPPRAQGLSKSEPKADLAVSLRLDHPNSLGTPPMAPTEA